MIFLRLLMGVLSSFGTDLLSKFSIITCSCQSPPCQTLVCFSSCFTSNPSLTAAATISHLLFSFSIQNFSKVKIVLFGCRIGLFFSMLLCPDIVPNICFSVTEAANEIIAKVCFTAFFAVTVPLWLCTTTNTSNSTRQNLSKYATSSISNFSG